VGSFKGDISVKFLDLTTSLVKTGYWPNTYHFSSFNSDLSDSSVREAVISLEMALENVFLWHCNTATAQQLSTFPFAVNESV
jgi:hypothetical protein